MVTRANSTELRCVEEIFPMRRELKVRRRDVRFWTAPVEPSFPMRRELKGTVIERARRAWSVEADHPDEEGTESRIDTRRRTSAVRLTAESSR